MFRPNFNINGGFFDSYKIIIKWNFSIKNEIKIKIHDEK